MSVLLAVDPGIDLAAAAVFRLDGPQASRWEDAARAFVEVSSRRTRVTDDTPTRCWVLHGWIAGQVERWGAETVVIEVPHTDQTYRSHRGRQRGPGQINAPALAKLNRSIAALQMGAWQAGAEVIEQPARYGLAFADKAIRHRLMNTALERAGRAPLAGNLDERDAAFLGMFWLGTRGGR